MPIIEVIPCPTEGLDSTGRPVKVGDRVLFREKHYTIKAFFPGEGRFGSARISFKEEDIHTDEIPDEISIDRT